MNEYVIISKLILPSGNKEDFKSTYKRSEREEFIKKWSDMIGKYYHENIRTFYIDYEKVQITEITDKLEQLKNGI